MSQQAAKTVGVVGGGSAGYLAALQLKKIFPELEVTVIESSKIPVVGVGEATTQAFTRFVHETMGYPVREFFQQTRPTFKLGVRLLWGKKDIPQYNNPFGTVNLPAAASVTGNISNMSLNSMLMDAGKSPLIRIGKTVTLPRLGDFAYQIDNKHFLGYLRGKLSLEGCHHLDAEIAEVKTAPDRGSVDHLVLSDGTPRKFDLYIDCSGFRSMLLGAALGEPWVDFSPSLKTDRAVLGVREATDFIQPYTSATTMPHGWLWNIPMHNESHLGYVFSSKHCSEEEAMAELQKHCRHVRQGHVVKFKTGRYRRSRVGNVVAVGNAYAFIEPLESTGLHMILTQLTALCSQLRKGNLTDAGADRYNTRMAARWDSLRWFIALHFRCNKKLDTSFWQECREQGDVSGLAEYIEHFKQHGPLSDSPENPLYESINADTSFRIYAHDAILAGCGVNERPMRIPDEREAKAFAVKYSVNKILVQNAMEHREAVEYLMENDCEFLERPEQTQEEVSAD